MKVPVMARNPRFWGVAYLCWLALLCIVSHISRIPLQPDVAGWDKVQHAVCFAAGGIILGLACGLGRSSPNWLAIRSAVILSGLAVGWFDEWHQSHVPGRSGNDVWDLCADFFGSCVAAWLLPGIWRRLKIDGADQSV